MLRIIPTIAAPDSRLDDEGMNAHFDAIDHTVIKWFRLSESRKSSNAVIFVRFTIFLDDDAGTVRGPVSHNTNLLL